MAPVGAQAAHKRGGMWLLRQQEKKKYIKSIFKLGFPPEWVQRWSTQHGHGFQRWAPSLSHGLGKGRRGTQSHARAGRPGQAVQAGWRGQPERPPAPAHPPQPATPPVAVLHLPTCKHLPERGGKQQEGWGADWQVAWSFSTKIQSRGLQLPLDHGQVGLEQDDRRSNMV